MKNYFCTLLIFGLILNTAIAQKTVIGTHPRILIDAKTKPFLLAKKAANNAEWQSLKAEADNYAKRQVLSWNVSNATVWNTAYIFYSYCGSSWMDAAFTLGMAHQLTKNNNAGSNPTIYSAKMLELADSIISAYKRFPPCSTCNNILQYNSSYADRNVGPALGVIYDWCYDELGATRKAALISMFNNWFNYARIPYNTYQNNVNSTGNYFFGHVLSAAYLGYATAGDNTIADEMIDYARQRVLGTKSTKLKAGDMSQNWLSQTYTGKIPSYASTAYLGPKGYTAAPQSEGLQVQGWSYGNETIQRLIDYCFIVKSATGENMADSLSAYFTTVLKGFTNALTPNRFQIDNSNDWGSFVGNVMPYSFPLRLSAVLQGSANAAQAQYFYSSFVKPVKLAAAYKKGYPELSWETMLYQDKSRASAAYQLAPYYPVPVQALYKAVPSDKALPKYYMRENWTDSATWCTLNFSSAFYDDHDHHNAGHFQIIRGDANDGDDQLLVGTNEIGNGGAFGLNGIDGGTCYAPSSSHSNTLFINDYNDYTSAGSNYVGGQSFYGYDEPTHIEQNINYSYLRADLSSAYYRKGDPKDTVNRVVHYYYRSLFYLREANLFFTFDQFKIKKSSNAKGEYQKHLRWHFMENPVVNGANISATMDNSKLFIHTVWPAKVLVNKVDESANPDNSFGPALNYAFNNYAYRAEVSEQGNPLQQQLLTVLQSGAKNTAEMNTLGLQSDQGNMAGTLVLANGKSNVVFFNKNYDKYLNPVSGLVSYPFAGDNKTLHTLCGMQISTKYQVDYAAGKVIVKPAEGGNYTSSAAGTLQFKIAEPSVINKLDAIDLYIYPNPAHSQINCSWKSLDITQIELLDISGKMLAQYKIQAGSGSFQVPVDKPGFYFVKLIKTNKESAIKKVVVY